MTAKKMDSISEKTDQQASTEQEKVIEALVGSGLRFIDAKEALERVVGAEGTPAVKDICDGFFRALEEAMEAQTQVNTAAARELDRLRGEVCS